MCTCMINELKKKLGSIIMWFIIVFILYNGWYGIKMQFTITSLLDWTWWYLAMRCKRASTYHQLIICGICCAGFVFHYHDNYPYSVYEACSFHENVNCFRFSRKREGGEKKRAQRARRTRGSNPGPAAC